MTIIAWHRELGIAVDSQCSNGESCNITITKYRIVDGVFYAGAGKAEMVERIFDCIEADTQISFDIEGAQVVAFKFATAATPVEVRRIATGSKRFGDTVPIPSAMWEAIGSGYAFAIAALTQGKTPAQAVALACKYDPQCGGKVNYFDIRGVEVC